MGYFQDFLNKDSANRMAQSNAQDGGANFMSAFMANQQNQNMAMQNMFKTQQQDVGMYQPKVQKTDNYGDDFEGMKNSGNPILMAAGAAAGAMGSAFDFASQGKFDYGQAGYTKEDAGVHAEKRGKNLGLAIGGPVLGMLGGFIAQKVAEAKAQKIIDHREAKMDSLADFQKEKIKENRFFRESDLEYGTDGNRFN
mgnify:FL=1